MTFENTRLATVELQCYLKCEICHNVLQKPCTLGKCEHFFCFSCIQHHESNLCPVCQVPSHKKDLQHSRQLATASSLCQQLLSLLSSSKYSKENQDELILQAHNSTSSFELSDGSNKPNFLVTCDQVAAFSEGEKKPDDEFHTETYRIDHKPTESDKNLDINEINSKNHSCVPVRSKRAKLNGSDTKAKMREKKLTNKITKLTKVVRSSQNSLETDGANSSLDILNICEQQDQKNCSKNTELSATKEGAFSKMELVPAMNRSCSSSQDWAGSNNNTAAVSVPTGQTGNEVTPAPKSRRASIVSPTSGETFMKRSSRRSSGRSKQSILKSPGGAKFLVLSPQLSKRNAKGETVLHLAAIKGDANAVKTILDSDFNPDVKDNAGWTPLHEACNRGFVDVATLLLDFNATIDMPGGDNETPLHDAVINGRVDCVKLLVSRGASVTTRDRHGRTPMDVAFTDIMKDALQVPVLDSFNKRNTNHILLTPSQAPAPVEVAAEKVVFMASGFDSKGRKFVKQQSRELGWTMFETYNVQATHLVIPVDSEGQCKRTIKFLQAVVSGLWVVDNNWLMQCHKNKVKLCEDEFEVPGCNLSPNNLAPQRARTNNEKQLPGLFDGCSFYIHGEFGQSGIPSRNELVQLVRLGGGSVLTREPKLEIYSPSEMTVPYHAKPSSALADCSFFIVSGSEKNIFFTDKGRKMCRVPPTWILICIAEFQLIDNLPSC